MNYGVGAVVEAFNVIVNVVAWSETAVFASFTVTTISEVELGAIVCVLVQVV